MDSKKKIKYDLDYVIKTYQNYLIEQIGDGNLYTKTIIINTVLQRSLSLIDAYKKILYSNNIMVLNALSRLQIDNCIFVYGMYYLIINNHNIDNIYQEIIKNNKKLSDYKVAKQKLYDTFLVEEINKHYNELDFLNMYEFCCRFIHYSDSASLIAMETKEKNIIELNLSSDYKKFSKQVITNGRSFINISKLVLLMIIDLWKNLDNGNKLNK